MSASLWNALIRTHHITSRKKVAKLRQAAAANDVFVLLRSGSSPGIMYVEGIEGAVETWVSVVQKLRYKDYQLVARPAGIKRESEVDEKPASSYGLQETDSVKVFGQEMQERGVYAWWRKAMGYAGQDDRL